jgi:intracellular multiplication protein IcmO
MKLEDPTDTWEFFMKSAGDAYVTAVESFNAQNPGLTGSYMDSKSAKAEKRARINLLDLKEQGVGEAHVFFKSNIVRANLFFMDPGPAKEMRLNVLMKVEIPKDEVLYTLVKSIEDFEQLINTSGIPEIRAEDDEALHSIVEATNKQPRMIDSIDRGMNVLFDVHKQQLASEADNQAVIEQADDAVPIDANSETEQLKTEPVQVPPQVKEIMEITDEESKKEQIRLEDAKHDHYINITSKVILTAQEKNNLAVTDNIELYEMPLVDRVQLRHQGAFILRSLGRGKDDADADINETLAKIEEKTLYRQSELIDLGNLQKRIDHVINDITTD